MAVGKGKELPAVKEIHFPHSLDFFTQHLRTIQVFKVNSGEYKIMGLAPYGKPRYADLIMKSLFQ